MKIKQLMARISMVTDAKNSHICTICLLCGAHFSSWYSTWSSSEVYGGCTNVLIFPHCVSRSWHFSCWKGTCVWPGQFHFSYPSNLDQIVEWNSFNVSGEGPQRPLDWKWLCHLLLGYAVKGSVRKSCVGMFHNVSQIKCVDINICT